MLRIDSDDNTTIHLTRGDRGTFRVYLMDSKTHQKYTFPAGCFVEFVVKPKKGYTEGDLLRKRIYLGEDTTDIEFTLTDQDTKIGEKIDKKTKYWYNIVVNNDVTITGSDENGEKILILYPETGENNE